MTAISIEDLDVVAVLGDVTSELCELRPVFRRRSATNVIAWPERVEQGRVIATEVDLDVLVNASEADADAAVLLAEPIAARGSDYALVGAADGHARYVRRDVLWARTRARQREWLSQAIEQWHDGDREAAVDNFDRAYLVSGQGVVAVVLRAGAARRRGDADWAEMCFDDLERALDYQGTDILACRANALWGELPHQSLLTELFDEARRGFDERSIAQYSFEPPVPERTRHLALAVAIYRRRHAASSARIPDALIVPAVAGDPVALGELSDRFSVDPDWSHCLEQARHEPSATHLIHASARAHLTDFDRFARTLYSLEMSTDQRDRRASWTSFARITAGVAALSDNLPWRAGKRMAEDARSRLGYNGGRIDGLRRFAEEQVGVFVGPMDAVGGYDCAASAPPNTPPCVFIRRREAHSNDEVLRSRFALAHELGHLLADRTWDKGWVCSTLGHDRSDVEKRANAFAAYFLAPVNAVRELVPVMPAIDSGDFYLAVQKVRATFGLSSIAAGEHLWNCHRESRPRPAQVDSSDTRAGALPERVRNQLASKLAHEPMDVHEDSFVDDNDGTLRGGRYRTLVERLKLAGVFDADKAASLLDPAAP